MAFVYVACAIDLAKGEQGLAEELAKELIRNDHGIYRPWRALEYHGGLLGGAPIRDINLAVIEQVDAVAAVISKTMSVGTVMDMVYAKGNGKPVYVLMSEDCERIPF